MRLRARPDLFDVRGARPMPDALRPTLQGPRSALGPRVALGSCATLGTRAALVSVVLSLVLSTGTACILQNIGNPNWSYNCNQNGLTAIPSGIPTTTQQLDLTVNAITSVQANALPSTLTALSTIMLQNNAITSIKPSAFVLVGASVTYIDLSFNLLTYLAPGVFNGLTKLQRLYLAGNTQLTRIEGGALVLPSVTTLALPFAALNTSSASTTFRGVTAAPLTLALWTQVGPLAITNTTFTDPVFGNVTQLNLNGDSITSLEAGAFRAFTTLIYLTIDVNNITSLQPGTFATLPLALSISVEKSLLTFIPAGVFSGSTIQVLSFAGNQITAIAPGAFANINLKTIFLYNNPCCMTCIPYAIWTEISGASEIAYGTTAARKAPSQVTVCSTPAPTTASTTASTTYLNTTVSSVPTTTATTTSTSITLTASTTISTTTRVSTTTSTTTSALATSLTTSTLTTLTITSTATAALSTIASTSASILTSTTTTPLSTISIITTTTSTNTASSMTSSTISSTSASHLSTTTTTTTPTTTTVPTTMAVTSMVTSPAPSTTPNNATTTQPSTQSSPTLVIAVVAGIVGAILVGILLYVLASAARRKHGTTQPLPKLGAVGPAVSNPTYGDLHLGSAAGHARPWDVTGYSVNALFSEPIDYHSATAQTASRDLLQDTTMSMFAPATAQATATSYGSERMAAVYAIPTGVAGMGQDAHGYETVDTQVIAVTRNAGPAGMHATMESLSAYDRASGGHRYASAAARNVYDPAINTGPAYGLVASEGSTYDVAASDGGHKYDTAVRGISSAYDTPSFATTAPVYATAADGGGHAYDKPASRLDGNGYDTASPVLAGNTYDEASPARAGNAYDVAASSGPAYAAAGGNGHAYDKATSRLGVNAYDTASPVWGGHAYDVAANTGPAYATATLSGSVYHMASPAYDRAATLLQADDVHAPLGRAPGGPASGMRGQHHEQLLQDSYS
eukprot:m.50055 g.50055  ORF g.50055 m.50055 type:complete len:970 (+) comp6189_c0_seq1:110-3019(+)